MKIEKKVFYTVTIAEPDLETLKDAIGSILTCKQTGQEVPEWAVKKLTQFESILEGAE